MRHHHLATEQALGQTDRTHAVTDYRKPELVPFVDHGIELLRTQTVVHLDEGVLPVLRNSYGKASLVDGMQRPATGLWLWAVDHQAEEHLRRRRIAQQVAQERHRLDTPLAAHLQHGGHATGEVHRSVFAAGQMSMHISQPWQQVADSATVDALGVQRDEDVLHCSERFDASVAHDDCLMQQLALTVHRHHVDIDECSDGWRVGGHDYPYSIEQGN
jgi:hypothetical protein